MSRAKAKRISLFNHKGGVGKTTLTFNLAFQLAELGNKVLLVDSDPQCNLTSHVLEGIVLDDLLNKSDTINGATVWSAVKPIVESSGPVKTIKTIELPGNSSRLMLLPGDIKLSDFEADLNEFWRECFQRKRRGFNGTMALSQLVNDICAAKDIDYVFYDAGPNIGALNRSILLDCDYFVVPVSYDLFSVRALQTLGRSLYTWVTEWETVCQLAPEDTYLMPGRPQFLGYIPQNFNVYGGAVASRQAKYSPRIEKGIQGDIIGILKPLGMIVPQKSYKLGEVKDFGQLVAASYEAGKPLYEVAGGNADQKAQAKKSVKAIADKLLKLIV